MSEEKKKMPAFPQNTFQKVGDVAVGECSPGMTLRDYFAAAALPILPTVGYKSHLTPEQTAYAAYEMADLMLRTREE